MGKVIAIVNQKGGVGKTTTSISLGASLALENRKVLLIDFDQQANATISLGFKREEITADVVDFLVNVQYDEECIKKTDLDLLWIMPGTIRLSQIQTILGEFEQPHLLLDKRLEAIKDKYDYILIDCPPSLGLEVDNSLYASDTVIIPVECGFYAYDALSQMIRKINEIQQEKPLEIEGILITKLDNRHTLSYTIVDKVKFMFPNKTFNTMITASSHLQEAPMHGKTVLQFSYNSRGAKEYRQLASEILGKEKK